MNLAEALSKVKYLLMNTSYPRNERSSVRSLSRSDYDAIVMVAQSLSGPEKGKTIRQGNVELWYNLGQFCLDQKMMAEAECFFRASIDIEPTFPGSWYFLGMLLGYGSTSPKIKEAEAALRRAVELAPDFQDAWTTLGYNLGHQKRNKESVEAFQKAIQLQPTHERSLLGLGAIYFEMGDFGNARKVFRKALEILSSDHPAREKILETMQQINANIEPQKHHLLDNAQMAVELEKFDEAIKIANQIIDLDPENVDALYILGNAYTMVNQPHEGIQIFEKLVKINPKDYLAICYLAMTYSEDLGNYEKAISLLKPAMEANPTWGDGWTNLGAIYHHAGQLDLAEAAFKKALVILPRDQKTLTWLAKLYDEKKNYKTALTYTEKLLQLAPGHPLYQMHYNRLLKALQGGTQSPASPTSPASPVFPASSASPVKTREKSSQIAEEKLPRAEGAFKDACDFISHGRYNEATAKLLEAQSSLSELAPHPLAIQILLKQGRISFKTQHRKAGIARREAALELAKKSGLEDMIALSERKLALYLGRKGKHDSALDHCNQAVIHCQQIKDNIGLAKTYLLQAETLIAQKKFDEAGRVFGQAKSLIPPLKNPILDGKLLLTSGLVGLNQDNPEKQIEILKQAQAVFAGAQDKRREARVLQKMMGIYEGVKKFTQAEECVQRTIDLFRQLGNQFEVARSYLALGTLCIQSGRREEASRYTGMSLQIAYSVNSYFDAAIAHSNLAFCAQIDFNYEGALDHFAQAMVLFDQVGKKKFFEHAKETLMQYAFCRYVLNQEKWDPKDAQNWNTVASLLLKRGNQQAANILLEHARELDPNNVGTTRVVQPFAHRFSLGKDFGDEDFDEIDSSDSDEELPDEEEIEAQEDADLEQEDVEREQEAQVRLEGEIFKDPKQKDLFKEMKDARQRGGYFATMADLSESMQAVFLAQEGKVDEAISVLHNVIREHPWNLNARNMLTMFYLQTNNYPAAEKSARDAIEHWPKEGEAWEHLGNVLTQTQQQSAALDAYHTAIKYQPKSPGAWCGIGAILATQGKETEAEAAFRNALKHDPKSGAALLFLAYLEQKRGKFAEVKALFTRVEASMPPDPHAAALLYNQYAWNIYSQKTGNDAVNAFGLELANKSIAKERGQHNLDTRACLLSCLLRYKEAKDDFLASIALRNPSQMSGLTWGEFKHVLQELKDKKTLAQYSDYFRNLPTID